MISILITIFVHLLRGSETKFLWGNLMGLVFGRQRLRTKDIELLISEDGNIFFALGGQQSQSHSSESLIWGQDLFTSTCANASAGDLLDLLWFPDNPHNV